MIDPTLRDPDGNGAWGDVLGWPIIPIHSIVLPNGHVLSFGSTEQGMQGGQFVYDLWDPVTNVHRTLPNTTGTNIFCSNMALDPKTGNVVIMGGDHNGEPGWGALTGRQDVLVYDYETQTIRDARAGDPAFDLDFARYYGTTVTLANGEILMVGGRDERYETPTIPEVYNHETGLRQLTGAEIAALADNPHGTTLTSLDGNYWYPHAYATSRGDVVVIEGDGESIYRMATEGAGSVTKVGALPFTSYALNPSIMFDADRIAITSNDGGLWVGDLSREVPTFTRVAELGSARTNAGLIPLPDGRVAIVGGGSAMDQGNVLTHADKEVAIWNPDDNSVVFHEDAALARLYHSSALMLPDGTIFSGGGGAPGPLTNLNAEIFTPATLFDETGNLAERPEITGAPKNVEAGTTFRITVDDASDIGIVSALRSGAMTHGRNSDVRLLKLDHEVIDAHTLEITTPGATVMGPGVWMLTVVDGKGVPSVSSLLGVDMAPLVETGPLVANNPIYNIDDEQIHGPFAITLEARFDDLDAGSYQRVFDFGNGPDKDEIWLGQVGTGDDMRFEIRQGGRTFAITARDAIVEGETATWDVRVDASGVMHLLKNGAELASGQGAVPVDVERTLNFVGASNWPADSYLRGMVRNLDITNAIVVSEGADTITGTSGDDVIDPRGGDDTVEAGAGNDTVYESLGRDVLDGGAGRDTLRLDSAATGAADWDVDLTRGTGGEGGAIHDNLYRNFENIVGGVGDDRIAGDDADNVLSGGAGDDTLIGRGGSDVLDGGTGRDTAEMSGRLADYRIEIRTPHRMDDMGMHDMGGAPAMHDMPGMGDMDDTSGTGAPTLSLTAADGAVTLLTNIEAVRFAAEDKTYAIDDVAARAGGSENVIEAAGHWVDGTNEADRMVGTAADEAFWAGKGDDVILGNGGFDQLDYDGSAADYRFTRNPDGTVTVTSDTYGTDTLTGISGFWFRGEEAWYDLDDLAPRKGEDGRNLIEADGRWVDGTGEDDRMVGTGADEAFWGGQGDDVILGNGGFDQVDYDGSAADYSFARNPDGTVTVTSDAYGTDTLSDISGFWFRDEGVWYDIEDLVARDTDVNGYAVIEARGRWVDGTDGDDWMVGTGADEAFFGGAGDDVFLGKGGDNQADYNGAAADYTITRYADGVVTVSSEATGTDTMTDIRGFWFRGEEAWLDIDALESEVDGFFETHPGAAETLAAMEAATQADEPAQIG